MLDFSPAPLLLWSASTPSRKIIVWLCYVRTIRVILNTPALPYT